MQPINNVMAVRIIKKSWWVDFRANHTRYRKRSPENSRAGALAYEATLRQTLARGDSIERTTLAAQQNQTFKEFAWKWFDEYAVPNNKFTEQRMKRSALRSSLIPFFGNIPIGEITTHHVEQFKAKCLKDGMGRKTINNRLAVLRKCIVTAYEWFQMTASPPKVKLLKCPPPRTDYLSPDECTLLLSKAEGVIYEMILTALRTGMRQGELKGLQWSSINWQNRSIVVRHSRCDYTKELTSPKSNRERVIPMHADVYEMLFKRKEDTGYVFLHEDGQPFDSQRLIRRLNRVRYKIGLRNIGWHTLRHTFASQLAVTGTPLHIVQMLLGHSTITTTMRYAHVAPSALRTAIDMLDPQTTVHENFGQPVGNRWSARQQSEMSNRVLVREKW
jgi:integrase